MVRFEELQELWQSQPQPLATVVDSSGMAHEQRRFGRRQILINTVKVALLVWQMWYCMSRLGLSVLSVLGQAILIAGMVSMLLTDWRRQWGIARLDFSRPSSAFVDSVLEQLRDPNAPFRHRFWLHMVLIGVGANLLLASRWAASTPQDRLVAHFTCTAAPFAAYALGLKFRAKRYSLEYRPLTDRLIAMKKALREQSL